MDSRNAEVIGGGEQLEKEYGFFRLSSGPELEKIRGTPIFWGWFWSFKSETIVPVQEPQDSTGF